MTLEHQQLAKVLQRQEAHIQATGGLCDIMEQTRAMVAELAAWLKAPPSQDLKEFMTRIALAVEANTASNAKMADAINRMEATIRQRLPKHPVSAVITPEQIRHADWLPE